MRIHFVRHGESQANLLHEISNRGLRHGLTPRGRQQAYTLAQRLENVPIARIYSSPVLRAIETSVLVAERLNVDYEVSTALSEYDCGVLEGRSDQAAWNGWREVFEAWTVQHRYEQRIEGGESFLDIRARFEPFIAGLVEIYGSGDSEILCVSHGGLYWMMLPLLLRNVDIQFISRQGLDYAALISADLKPDGFYCVEWNGRPFDQMVDGGESHA